MNSEPRKRRKQEKNSKRKIDQSENDNEKEKFETQGRCLGKGKNRAPKRQGPP